MSSSRRRGKQGHRSSDMTLSGGYYDFPEQELYNIDTGQGDYYTDATAASSSYPVDLPDPYTEITDQSNLTTTTSVSYQWPTTAYAGTETSFPGDLDSSQ